MSELKDMWVITTREISWHKVCFEEPVSQETAVEMFLAGEYDDIIDSDVIDTEAAWIGEEP